MGDRQPWRQDDDDEEEVDESNYKTQKDAILLAIDVSSSMLKSPPHSESKRADRDSPLAASLKCAYHLMKQRIISNPKDMMGILLFGTEKSKFKSEDDSESNGNGNGSLYPHCYLFTDLDVPGAEDVKALKELAEEDDIDGVLVPKEGDKFDMSNVLFCANQLFTTKAANFGSRRLFIITDNADPHANDKKARDAAAVRAKDLFDLGVVIELFPIIRDDEKFDLSKFYDDIIYRDPVIEANMNEIGSSKSGDGLTLLNSLITNINSRQTAKRALFSGVSFEIAPGLSISVKGYNVLNRQKEQRSCYVWPDGDVAQIAVGETTKISEDTARTVQKTEVKKAYKFGGEFIYFTPEEQKALKDFGSPIIRIIGFKPQSMLPIWACVKKSTFIFPSEEHYVGSTRVFSALWQKLLKSKKMGIAWFVARSNAKPVLAAVLASPLKTPENPAPYLPTGLWLYPLPFVDDIRPPPDVQEYAPAPDDLVAKMGEIIDNLKLPGNRFDPSRYPNPQLQWHYRILQAMALQDEMPERNEAEDTTVPRYKQIFKRAGADIREWEAMVDEEYVALEEQSKKNGAKDKKRGGGMDDYDEAGDVKPRKKVKTGGVQASDNNSYGVTDAQLKKMSNNGNLALLKVVDLKEMCSSRGLATQGKKVDLVQRLDEWLDGQP